MRLATASSLASSVEPKASANRKKSNRSTLPSPVELGIGAATYEPKRGHGHLRPKHFQRYGLSLCDTIVHVYPHK